MAKQRMSRDLVARRYYELLAGGMTKFVATQRIGMLVLDFYGIEKAKPDHQGKGCKNG